MSPSEPHSEPRLAQVQRWMQTVIMHRGGVAEGVGSPEASEHLEVGPAELESVIRPSRSLSSADRLEIYVNAYYARLMECLDEEFAVTRYALGDELFAAVTFGYLQHYPSASYTLGQLGANFPSYLAESRLHAADPPEGAGPTWAEFIAELAAFERTLYEVYDGPGTEGDGSLQSEALARIATSQWDRVRLRLAPCLRLARFDHPVHEYWAVRKDGHEPGPSAPRASWLAIHRRDYVVEPAEVSRAQFALLAAIGAEGTLGGAIAAALAAAPDDAELAARLGDWFARWAAAGYFMSVEATSP